MKFSFIQEYSVGQKIGALTLLEYTSVLNGKIKRSAWRVACECGKTWTVRQSQIKNQKLKSCKDCGNKNKKTFKDGPKVRAMPEHGSWRAMLYRCKYDIRYQHVTVCERWHCFQSFYEDMGQRPSEKHSIDRIDGTKGYYLENCRWADTTTQNRNKPNIINIQTASEIKRLRNSNLTHVAISKKLGISKWVSQDVSTGRTWKES